MIPEELRVWSRVALRWHMHLRWLSIVAAQSSKVGKESVQSTGREAATGGGKVLDSSTVVLRQRKGDECEAIKKKKVRVMKRW
jgi:hypothetical protein